MIRIQLKSFATDPTKLSNEEIAAQELKDSLEKDLASYPNATGTIYIMTSIRIFGQKRNDIDILVVGFIDNLTIQHVQSKNIDNVVDLEIKSFICNFEIKSHPATGVKRDGTDYIVSYKRSKENASRQCNEAKFSLFNHLQDQLSIKPFICDILWFNGLSKADILSMRGASLDNALHCAFNFKDLINAILLQANVRTSCTNEAVLDCFTDGEKDFKSIVDLFSTERKVTSRHRQEINNSNRTRRYRKNCSTFTISISFGQ